MHFRPQHNTKCSSQPPQNTTRNEESALGLTPSTPRTNFVNTTTNAVFKEYHSPQEHQRNANKQGSARLTTLFRDSDAEQGFGQ